MLMEHNMEKTIIVLHIPDAFSYKDPTLMSMIKHNYSLALKGDT